MTQWQLVYFEGCPNSEKLKSNLEEVGLTSFELIEQGSLEPGHPLKKYASPSLLRDGELLVGALTGSSEGGCSLCLPSVEELKILLERRDL